MTATVTSRNGICHELTASRGSRASETPFGDSEPQPHGPTLNLTFGVVLARDLAVDFTWQFNVGAKRDRGWVGRETEQHDFSGSCFDSRSQQQVSDNRLANEQRHCWPRFVEHVLPVICDRLNGKLIDVSVNHTAQNVRAARQLKKWRRNPRAT